VITSDLALLCQLGVTIGYEDLKLSPSPALPLPRSWGQLVRFSLRRPDIKVSTLETSFRRNIQNIAERRLIIAMKLALSSPIAFMPRDSRLCAVLSSPTSRRRNCQKNNTKVELTGTKPVSESQTVNYLLTYNPSFSISNLGLTIPAGH
jgi:hypothetical protein